MIKRRTFLQKIAGGVLFSAFGTGALRAVAQNTTTPAPQSVSLLVAVALPDSLKQFLSQLQHGVTKTRWISTERLHIQIRHLGAQPAEKIPEIESMLLSSISEMRIPEITFTGVKLFEKGRVVLDIQDSPEWVALREKVEIALAPLQLPAVNFSFYNPHIVLGILPRHADYLELSTYLQRHAAPSKPSEIPAALALYEQRKSTIFNLRRLFPIQPV